MENAENKTLNEEIKEEEIKEKKDFSLIAFITENKTEIYSIMFYIAGLLAGSYIYKTLGKDVLDSLLKPKKYDFLQLFLNNLSVYYLIFAIVILLGICLIGFPFINIIPLVIGFESGIKIAYYYMNYSAKGIGYSLLMIIPYVSLYLTLIIFTIEKSYEMSRKIYDLTIKKTDMTDNLNYKSYLKSFSLYALFIVFIALFNSGMNIALTSIISI